MNPAIVYLAQNRTRDPQYGRDSNAMLRKSLDLLFANYNDQFRHPVLIFHEGDFSPDDQADIVGNRDGISFVDIQFEIPSFLPRDEIPDRWFDGEANYFGLGHRHMIRFFGLLVFDILHDLGFDWFFRLDDDSYIHSPIRYDMFRFMEERGFEYGYRVDVQEPGNCSWGFGETVYAYVKSEHITPTSFFDHWQMHGVPPVPVVQRSTVQRVAGVLRHPVGTARRIASRLRGRATPPVRLASFPDYDLWGYYNNFFITRVGFWRSPEVQRFLHHLDRLGGGYKYRWNDLIVHSAAVQIFLPPAKVHKFEDWTYEHATIVDGELKYGGIFAGSDDTDLSAVREFVRVHQRAHGQNMY